MTNRHGRLAIAGERLELPNRNLRRLASIEGDALSVFGSLCSSAICAVIQQPSFRLTNSTTLAMMLVWALRKG